MRDLILTLKVDIIYHKPKPGMQLDATKRLEQTQYSAALAVTGAWRGTNRLRLSKKVVQAFMSFLQSEEDASADISV